MNERRPPVVPASTRQVERPALSLHIDRVVLDGLPLTAAQGAHLQVALEQELARLWTQRETHAAPQAFSGAAITAPALAVGSVASPAHLGRDAARSLFTMLRFA